MNFLFPWFLAAAGLIAIPILLHLFNLRKYKRVRFSDTKLLQDLQIKSKRSAKIHNWPLLLLRILFILLLVLAFSQPYWSSQQAVQSNLSVLYIDNSYSMASRNGQTSLLDKARQHALAFIAKAHDEQQFIIATNNAATTVPLNKTQALPYVEQIGLSGKNTNWITTIKSLAENNNKASGIYVFSDFQVDTNTFNAASPNEEIATPIFVDVQKHAEAENLVMDTAYFLSPFISLHQPNNLVVQFNASAEVKQATTLAVEVNGQVNNVLTIPEAANGTFTDSLSLTFSQSGWNTVTLILQNNQARPIDTLRMAVEVGANNTILLVAEKNINPYLLTFLKLQPSLKYQQVSPAALTNAHLKVANFIIWQDVNVLTENQTAWLQAAMALGKSVFLTPAANLSTGAFSAGLQKVAPIKLESLDTSEQQVIVLQSQHALFSDVFESLPENTQLPVAYKSYPILASLTANEQVIMKLRNGKPFLAQYDIDRGKLFWLSSTLDTRFTNLMQGHFWVPMLYKMAHHQSVAQVLSAAVGSSQGVWLPSLSNTEREVWKLKDNDGKVFIPAQQAEGAGVQVFVGQYAQDLGYYQLYTEGIQDTFLLGMNVPRGETSNSYFTAKNIADLYPNAQVQDWSQQNWEANVTTSSKWPIWKWLALIALLALGTETYFLLKKKS